MPRRPLGGPVVEPLLWLMVGVCALVPGPSCRRSSPADEGAGPRAAAEPDRTATAEPDQDRSPRPDEAAPDAAAADAALADAGAAAGGPELSALRIPAAELEGLPRQIDDPTGEAMTHVYGRLLAAARREPGALVRIAVYTVSTNGSDRVTGTLRRELQARFGDGGKGWVPIAPGWGAQQHRDVEWTHRGWRTFIVNWGEAPLGRYGLGGVLVTGAGRSSRATFGTVDEGPCGRSVSRFRLFYQGWPQGGEVWLSVDEGEPQRLGTRSAEVEDRVHEVRVPAGAHRLALRGGEGELRLYGVVMETEGPGVVMDALMMLGVSAGQLESFDAEHLATQVRLRRTDLLVFWLGGNDVMHRDFSRQWLLEHYGGAIGHARRGRPEASCLVISTLDKAYEDDRGRTRSRRRVPAVVAAQEEVARAQGCAFFNLYEATGGEGTMERWARSAPRMAAPDLLHLTEAGAEHVGGLMTQALLAGYDGFLAGTEE